MWIAEARKRTSKKWRNTEITWEQFVKRISVPMYTGETVREYKAMSKEDRDIAKEANGGFVAGYVSGGQRKTENIRERSMVVIDADNAKSGDWERVTAIYDDFAMLCYSTHSHTPQKPRLRWVIPTSRPMTPEEYPAVSRMLASWIGLDTVDPTTHDVARLFYWPSTPRGGEYVCRVQDGELLDPDYVLSLYGPDDQWKDTTLWPISAEEQEIRLSSRQRLGDPCEKNGMIGLFCRAYDVPAAIDEFLPDVYTECTTTGTGEPRYTYTKGSTAGGAVVYNDGAYLFSNHATDPCGGRSVNAFDLVRIHMFGDLDEENDTEDTPVTKLNSYKAMCKWCAELPGIKEEIVKERIGSIDSDFADLVCEDGDDSWKQSLALNHKTGELDPTIENAMLILLNDPALKGRFGLDLFSGYPRVRDDLPWDRKVKDKLRGDIWEDTDDAGLRFYLESVWHFTADKRLLDAFALACKKCAYHPVREYLEGLTWDGTPRLDTLLVDYFGAEDNIYVRAAARKWMCGAVARVMQPGCKFDSALILSGEQGLGKSTFCQIISKGWYNDSDISMGDKEGYLSLHGSWIIELAELSSVKKKDIETVKTFISKSRDTYRAPYERRLSEHARQCVFFGTTNEIEILRDRSGSRRFWPIEVATMTDFDRLEQNTDQLWAEALYRWRQGERLYMDDENVKAVWLEESEMFTESDDLQAQVLEFLDRPLCANWYDLSPESRRDYINGDVPGATEGTERRDYISLAELKVEMLGLDRRKAGTDRTVSLQLSGVLQHLKGWRKQKQAKKVRGYGAQKVYARKKDDKRRWDREHRGSESEDSEAYLD